MTKDIIVSRRVSVGPNGHFMPGPDDGPVTVSINFFRPALHPDRGPDMYPAYICEYEIRYGDAVIHASDSVGMDGVAALLSAMVDAVTAFDNRYFNARVPVPQYLDAIPTRYLDDMRNARGQPTPMTP